MDKPAIAAVLAEHTGAEAVYELWKAAMDKGGPDNITLALVEFVSPAYVDLRLSGVQPRPSGVDPRVSTPGKRVSSRRTRGVCSDLGIDPEPLRRSARQGA